MLRDIERSPLLTGGAVPPGSASAGDIAQLAQKLVAVSERVTEQWSAELPRIFGETLDPARQRALLALNPGSTLSRVASGDLAVFTENVEYHARRLAKLDVPPDATVASIGSYHRLLCEELRCRYPDDWGEDKATLSSLDYRLKLALNNAYFQVRDVEATAFYDLLRDQLESLSVQELLERALQTLLRTFRSAAGVITMADEDGPYLQAKAWRGMDANLACAFNARFRRGFSGQVAARRQADAIVDTRRDDRIGSEAVRTRFRSVWGAPLLSRDRVLGVVQVAFEHEYQCLPREMKLFEAIAERCAMAIEKAQLVEELAEREERIRSLSEHMTKVEEEERRRISRELHDEVGQSLLVVRLNLEMIPRDLPATATVARQKVEATRAVVEDTIIEMRRLISKLSPSVLQEMGLPASIRQFVKNLTRNFPGRIRMRLSNLEDLPERTKIMMYRLVQECFTNAVKHSGADNISLQMARGDRQVHMQLEDDGVGFDMDEALSKRESFGLSGMQERVALLGGRISIDSAPGEGARVSISIPL